MNNLEIRYATVEDTSLILQFIKELAEYEQLLNEVVATEEILRVTGQALDDLAKNEIVVIA